MRARVSSLGLPPPPVERRYHVHLPGIAYALVTVVLALGAVNSQNNLLFWALGLALGGLLASGVCSGAALLGVSVERLPTTDVGAGEELIVRYAVRNTNRWIPAFALTITEHDLADPGPAARSPRQRPVLFVPYVGARRVLRVEGVIVPRGRGILTLSRMRVSSTFPLGLARKSVTFDAPHRVVVHPPSLDLGGRALELIGRRGNMDSPASPRQGEGEEFFALREYLPGDPVRSIAWKPSARLARVVVRQNTRPRPARRWIGLDFSGVDPASSEARVLRERILALAGSVVRRCQAEDIPVGLVLPGPGGVSIPPRTGSVHASRLLGLLATIDEQGWRDAAPLFHDDHGEALVVHAGGRRGGLDARAIEPLLRRPPANSVVRALLGLGEGRP